MGESFVERILAQARLQKQQRQQNEQPVVLPQKAIIQVKTSSTAAPILTTTTSSTSAKKTSSKKTESYNATTSASAYAKKHGFYFRPQTNAMVDLLTRAIVAIRARPLAEKLMTVAIRPEDRVDPLVKRISIGDIDDRIQDDWASFHPNDQGVFLHGLQGLRFSKNEEKDHYYLRKGILGLESQGFVGFPNYTYKRAFENENEIAPNSKTAKRINLVAIWAGWVQIWAELQPGPNGVSPILRSGAFVKDKKTGLDRSLQSTATGLGQLTTPNIDSYFPGLTNTERRSGMGKPIPEAIGLLRYVAAPKHGTPQLALQHYGTKGEGY